ncbi:OX-2 membrane glycoprotein-like, partial [Pristimantis euphronides]
METARIGGNVTLQCELMTLKESIIQITWHKESGNLTGTVATASKYYGQKLLGYYTNRAKHSTNNTHQDVSAITISPVIPEDEGCFKCIFNLFPFGASTGTICLEVYEANLMEPNLEVQEMTQPDSLDKLYIVTCSATGRPAPKITWIPLENLDISPETYTIINLNKSEMVISNFTLRTFSILDMRISVICVVHHPSLSSEKHLLKVIERSQHTESKFPPFAIFALFIVSGILIGI